MEVTMKEKLEKFALFVGGLVGIVGAIIVGGWFTNLSPDAKALGMGVLGGCLLGLVPVGVLIVIALGIVRWYDAKAQRRAAASKPAQPQSPVVIVAGGQLAGNPYSAPYPTALPPTAPDWPAGSPRRQRHFEIIGDGN
jgi:hypothetical protein